MKEDKEEQIPAKEADWPSKNQNAILMSFCKP